MTAEPATLDMEKVEQTAGLAFGYLGGFLTSGMIYLGDKLGLYRTMAGLGPVTSAELAATTSLSERWLREWLSQQGAAGLLDYHGEGRFQLSPEAALVLADENNPASVIGGFGDIPHWLPILQGLPTSFETGLGLTYDQAGPGIAAGTERLLGPFNRTELLNTVVPAIDGLKAKLEAGAKVADIGCGAMVADVTLGGAFPKSEFHGFDNSQHALERARANIKESSLKNVTAHDIGVEPMPGDGSFDFAMCLDCLHDMDRPDLALDAIRKALKPDGLLLIVDVNCGDNYEANAENPLGPTLYGFSIMLCMSSSASSAEGMALGTLGLPQPKMEALVKAAGFSEFGPIPGVEHPFNAFYVARP